MSNSYLKPLLIVLAIVAILAGSFYLYLKLVRGVPELPEPEMPTVSPPPEEPPPPPPAIILPALDDSDDFIRPLVRELSSHPQLARWLVNDELVRRFVTVIDNVSRGESPRVHVPFLEPKGGFEVREKDGRTVIAQRSFRRYDLFTAVVASLDTGGSVRLYRDLYPLFEEAYAELGNPDTFDDALGKAIDRLLAVEVPGGDVEVRRRVSAFGFADPQLEGLGAAEKHLLRLGPDNAREIQAKLLAFKTALALTRTQEE